mmetsp:Transcript_10075/g.22647  ORF Transcript_10075/g.22647 Transcript_10075/m.22647 type:complete len:514 (+) Transcript_10075:153-1694(+)
MVFFRLGKIEKTGGGPTSQDPPGGASPLSPSASSSAIAQDKAEKPKVKNNLKMDDREPLGAPTGVHGGGPGGGGGGASSSNRGTGLSVNDFISKTKNQQRQGLKPSGPELIAYARYLGIDPVADHDLLWIAVEALEAPLPSDWTEHFDSNDRVFYYNAQMRVSSWTHPLEHIYRETYKTIVNLRNANISAQERNERMSSLQAEVKQMEHDVHKEIAQWTEHTDEQGNRFYFNREERQSTWTDPRPAKCQVLYLKMKMIRLLVSGSGAAFSSTGLGGDKGDLMRFGDRPSDHHMEDHGSKKPKVGSHKPNEGGTTTTWSHNLAGGLGVGPGGGTGGPGSAAGAFSEDEGMTDHQQSLMDGETPENSDSDSEDRKRKKKKKKKHKKHEKRDKDKHRDKGGSEAEGPAVGGPGVAPPPRPGTQNLRNSSSEPSVGNVGGVGGKSMHSNVEEVRGNMGMQASALGLGSLEQEGLNSVGRAKVKAGIRLEPLASGDVMLGAGGLAPKGGQGSASVPSL